MSDNSSTATVPFADLGEQHRRLKQELEAAASRVIASSGFVLGGEVQSFENEIAGAFGVKHAVGISNGTDAIHLAFRALGIGPGDEIIVPSWTYIASVTGIRMSGATPVFADVDPATYHVTADTVREKITPRTRAVLPVHMYGQPVDMNPLLSLAEESGLEVVEDACQAHGASMGAGTAGSAGKIGCFSFYPSKNLGALGDGGLLVTNDDGVAETARRLRNHGGIGRNEHPVMGYNARLDGLQAAFLRVKLPHLAGWNQRRRELGARYNAELAGLPLGLPLPADGRDHVFHLYVVRTEARDRLQKHLDAANIQSGIHYPVPAHRCGAHADLATADVELPNTESLGAEVLSLPISAELSDQQQSRVIESVRTFFA